jgi:hypothetical protein
MNKVEAIMKDISELTWPLWELYDPIESILNKHIQDLESLKEEKKEKKKEHQCEFIMERKIWPLWTPIKTWNIICCYCWQKLKLSSGLYIHIR